MKTPMPLSATRSNPARAHRLHAMLFAGLASVAALAAFSAPAKAAETAFPTKPITMVVPSPPGGVAGMTIARLFGEEPNMQLQEDMHRFKQVMEVGEVILSEATVTKGARLRQDPAQPPPPEKLPDQLPADISFDQMMGQSGTAATA